MNDLTTTGGSPLRAANSLDIMLNGDLFDRAIAAAKMLAKADGFVPRHLLGKTEACFAVVMQAHDWRLSPLAVARCTYQTPSGQVGYEGKLIHAIIEQSGQTIGGVSYEHFGDWPKVQGKFEIRKGSTGKDYAAATWKRADAEGLGVIVRAKLKGELEPREFRFNLEQAFPLNSTLWATDPKTQICYTACRRFASLAVPHLVMGVPFDGEPVVEHLGPERAKDITPADDRRAAMEAADAPVVDPEPLDDSGYDPDTGEVEPPRYDLDGDSFTAGDWLMEADIRRRTLSNGELEEFIKLHKPTWRQIASDDPEQAYAVKALVEGIREQVAKHAKQAEGQSELV